MVGLGGTPRSAVVCEDDAGIAVALRTVLSAHDVEVAALLDRVAPLADAVREHDPDVCRAGRAPDVRGARQAEGVEVVQQPDADRRGGQPARTAHEGAGRGADTLRRRHPVAEP